MKKEDLIKNIIETEERYSLEFSLMEKTSWGLRFTDELLPDMHCHNFLRIYRDKEIDLVEAVTAEADFRKEKGQEAVQVELFGGDWDKAAKLLGEENLDEHLIMFLKITELKTGAIRDNVRVIRALSEEELEMGKQVDLLTFGSEYAGFSHKRFERKAIRYRDKDSSFNHFVCLADGEPVGNCDFFTYKGFGKIEDFDVIGSHQRKGFGSAIIKGVSSYGEGENVEYLFLQVERDNSAVEMYKKLGFQILFNNIIYNKPVKES